MCAAPNETGAVCGGFTYYPDDKGHAACCLRTSTASKPADPASTARCYEKAGGGGGCTGAAWGVILNGPSLTEGFPATNPSLRLLGFDSTSNTLTDVWTYYADLHDANKRGKLDWVLEYDMRAHFGMPDLSAASFEQLHTHFAANATLWDDYRGKGAGSLYVGRYSGSGAANPPSACTGTCKAQAIATLNQTTTGA